MPHHQERESPLGRHVRQSTIYNLQSTIVNGITTRMLHTNVRLIAMLILVMLVACGTPPQVAPPSPAHSEPASSEGLQGELIVFAAASLTEAFGAIGTKFETLYPGTRVSFNFAGSQQLVAQLQEGAPVDLFASAHMAQMAMAIESGRVTAGTEQIFAHNRLAIVTSAANPAELAQMVDLARPGLRLILADEAVPVGHYSREVLERASKLPEFGSNYAASVLANVVSFEQNVRVVLTKVGLGEADAGIVYLTDVQSSSEPLLELLIPEEINSIAAYPIARLNDTSKKELADAFVAFVLGAEGQAILATYGFQ
ncbi:molybdate ABC transporter substrate-binding protein [Candidatus Viridilinea mediisalina]|nr:molybdate ABC transporter substrate-binding protein [Candidatus Viridilinea mediisalina]